jgi:uncharacterized GH25 family protein
MGGDEGGTETDRPRVRTDWTAGVQARFSIDEFGHSVVVDRRGSEVTGTSSSQVDACRGHQYDHDPQRQLLHAEFLRLPSGPSDGTDVEDHHTDHGTSTCDQSSVHDHYPDDHADHDSLCGSN